MVKKAKAAMKKKHIRLKKRIRQTLGTLFLASAILVAAIPADYLQAAPGDLKVTVTDEEVNIPIVGADEHIYTTGDGRFQFAYVTPKSGGDKVAVILGYNSVGELPGGELRIPDRIDVVYDKYTYNMGTSTGYVAVGASGKYLYYEEMVPEIGPDGQFVYDEVDTGEVDEEGNPIMEKVQRMRPEYYPCFYETRNKWMPASENPDLTNYYFKLNESVSSNDASNFCKTTDQYREHQMIVNIMVAYVGNQYVEISQVDKKWHVAGTVNDSNKRGVFADASNIEKLVVGSNLSGIGNYAFYGCTMLNSITLGNGLEALGNHAFEDCINLKTVNVDVGARLMAIGDHAFYNCSGLTSFAMPVAVQKVGDSAFENCSNLENIDLRGGGRNANLKELGNHVFRNCSSLKALEFPDTFNQVLPISVVQGCASLGHITVPWPTTNFVDDVDDPSPNGPTTDYTLKQFKQDVPKEFYFEGVYTESTDPKYLYNTAKKDSFAFKFLNEDIYEIVIPDETNPNIAATFQVNSNNELLRCDIPKGMANINIPETVGPYKITKIGSDSFQNNCHLQKLTIPSSITEIAASAFQGCHELENVIFTEPVNITSIGANAFQTQITQRHPDDCPDKNPENNLNPVLTFTGPVSDECVPFLYAMDPGSNINVGSQETSYIKYYSGWPENLTVQYNRDTDKNELIDYPTFSRLDKLGTGEYNYPYLTPEQINAAKKALGKYLRDHGYDGQGSDTTDDVITQDEQTIINASSKLVFPRGIEAVREGLFKDLEAEDVSLSVATGVPFDKTITTDGIAEIPDNTFEGCANLVGVAINGATTSIGNYAFKDCKKLETASISNQVSSIGIRPFAGCPILENVDFQGSPYFTCENAIIFGLTDSKKTAVVQCLENRGIHTSSTVSADELAGIETLYEEAFAGCPDLGTVDLSKSVITTVPRRAFADTEGLYSVSLPDTCKSIGPEAFAGSKIKYVDIPQSVSYIEPSAFDIDSSMITFYCVKDSAADIYASQRDNIITADKPEVIYYDVMFMDYDESIIGEVQSVLAGEDAVPPEDPVREGYDFTRWLPDYKAVGRDLTCVAQYEPKDVNYDKHKVEFYDKDNELIDTVYVNDGEDAKAPPVPEVEGYNFVGWRPPITNVKSDLKAYAEYQPKDSSEESFVVRFFDYNEKLLYTQTVRPGDSIMAPKDPVRAGYKFVRWTPDITKITTDTDVYATYEREDTDPSKDPDDPGKDPSKDPSGSSSTSTSGDKDDPKVDAKYYTLTVKNGSGSGSYVAGSQVIVIANDPPEGQEFSNWTVDPSTVSIASKNVSATVLTMPESAVTVTANYAAKGSTATTGSSNTSTNNSTNNGNGTNSGTTTRPGGSSGGSSNNNNNNNNGNTTVVIDKNGLSNTGVVSATVNGSSDNFVIKITESADATEKVVKALMNEYGDLTDIKYFPMDISLYDSTGNTKITDTTGLSISITLPLPDSLITYAGNNKVAGVVDEKLDKLTPKFTTINGVSCITFKAEHFSPYTIYVDTANLTAGTIADNTPKTGDGIHPKWFLSVGLACISMVLFMKRDKRVRKRMATA